MKIFYQILIIIFVIGSSVFILRNDFGAISSKISSYFNKNIKSPIIQLTQKEHVLQGKIDMPGALRVVSDLLNTNNTHLSKDIVISLTNKYRKDNGDLAPLKENSKLDASAEKKLQDMFTNQYFEHISPKSKKGVGDLGEEAGYKYILIGENLAMGNFKDDQDLMNAWIKSEGHRENIVNKHYTEIGVAVGKGKFEGKDIWMAVQHFGTPKSVCPSISSVLYSSISLNQSKIKTMESNLTLRLSMINKGVVYEGNTHDEQITIYNSLINDYNNLLKDIKEKINNYNIQIRAFNTCLLSYQQ
jgi:uncharacterized protein YkwD